MGVSGDDFGLDTEGNMARASLHPIPVDNDAGAARLDGSTEMPSEPAVFGTDLFPRSGIASWLHRRPDTVPPESLDGDGLVNELMGERPGERPGEVEEVLGRAGLFQGVEPSAVSALITRLPRADFPRGHRLFTEGEPGDRLYIIIRGKVKIGRRSPDGREKLLTILGPSDIFGEMSIFDPGPRTSSATTITGVRAVSMDRDALRSWIAGRPEITERLLRVLARRLRRTNDGLVDLIFTDVAGRVAKQLLALAQRFGTQEAGAMRVTHDLTQEEIAQLVGASRETVNKALADFAQRGWITLQGKSILILDSERLARRAR